MRSSIFFNRSLMRGSKHSKKKRKELKQSRLFYIFLLISVAINIMAVYFAAQRKHFLIGDMLLIVITIFNVCAFTIKRCIFERAISKDEQYITLKWCCNLTLGRKPIKRKKKRIAYSIGGESRQTLGTKNNLSYSYRSSQSAQTMTEGDGKDN